MYLLTVKDGLGSRYVGPYETTSQASADLERVLSTCSDRARWKIHALESPSARSLSERFYESNQLFSAKAS